MKYLYQNSVVTKCIVLLIIGISVFLVRAGDAVSNNSLTAALSYYNSPQRSQLKAAELLEQLIPEIDNNRIKRTVYLDLARLFSQSYDHNSEKPNYPKSIDFYKSAIALKQGQYSLAALEARDELADLLMRENKDSEASTLLLEVINAKGENICKDELNPQFIANLTALDAREKLMGISDTSALHKRAVTERMERSQNNVMNSYKIIRESSIRTLAILTYRKQGVAGVEDLFKQWGNDPQARTVLKEVLTDYAENG